MRVAGRHPQPPIFRRRMILQLTSLLDLLLIIVFVQYLEMQHVSARETERRQDVEAQRDRLLAANQQNLYEVWEIHLNGNRSVYPDGSMLVSSATQKKILQPGAAGDFVNQLVGVMKFSPKPASPCIFLLTWGNVRRDALEQARDELRSAANDARLKGAWDAPGVQFKIVEGGYLEER
jgi:hypothetical protein